MAQKQADSADGAAPVYRAVMRLANSFYAPAGLTVQGEKRDAVDGFVVANTGEAVDVPTDNVDVLHAVQLAVELGRAVPATA